MIPARKKIRAKLLATTAATPAALRPSTGCSREDPHPKFSPARITSPGWTSPAKDGSRSSNRWGRISSGVEQS